MKNKNKKKNPQSKGEGCVKQQTSQHSTYHINKLLQLAEHKLEHAEYADTLFLGDMRRLSKDYFPLLALITRFLLARFSNISPIQMVGIMFMVTLGFFYKIFTREGIDNSTSDIPIIISEYLNRLDFYDEENIEREINALKDHNSSQIPIIYNRDLFRIPSVFISILVLMGHLMLPESSDPNVKFYWRCLMVTVYTPALLIHFFLKSISKNMITESQVDQFAESQYEMIKNYLNDLLNRSGLHARFTMDTNNQEQKETKFKTILLRHKKTAYPYPNLSTMSIAKEICYILEVDGLLAIPHGQDIKIIALNGSSQLLNTHDDVQVILTKRLEYKNKIKEFERESRTFYHMQNTLQQLTEKSWDWYYKNNEDYTLMLIFSCFGIQTQEESFKIIEMLQKKGINAFFKPLEKIIEIHGDNLDNLFDVLVPKQEVGVFKPVSREDRSLASSQASSSHHSVPGQRAIHDEDSLTRKSAKKTFDKPIEIQKIEQGDVASHNGIHRIFENNKRSLFISNNELNRMGKAIGDNSRTEQVLATLKEGNLISHNSTGKLGIKFRKRNGIPCFWIKSKCRSIRPFFTAELDREKQQYNLSFVKQHKK